MDTRENRRGHKEFFIKAKHLKLTDLKEEAQGIQNQYLFKENIPLYPRPEIHVSHLKHDTDSNGIVGIGHDTGFRPLEGEAGDETDPLARDLVWWSLSVGPQDLDSAEKKLLDDTYPDRTEEQQKFLRRFATSPAFLETSRFGSYRFTFPLEELLDAYRQQLCCGSEPVLRVYETVLYKQEVMYSVLVHSHFNNELFNDYPLLTDSEDAVCAYKDGRFIWRPEAMCETHRYQLVQKPYQNQFAAHLLSEPKHEFYVWDNVAVAFHMFEGQTLTFDMYQLRSCLTFSEPGPVTITPDFDSFEDATELVEAWWPYYPSPFF